MGCCDKKKLNIKMQEIADGWKNYIFPNEKTEIIAKNRAAICNTCIHKVYTAKKALKIPYCELCGCPIATKVRSLQSVCPADPPKWNKA